MRVREESLEQRPVEGSIIEKMSGDPIKQAFQNRSFLSATRMSRTESAENSIFAQMRPDPMVLAFQKMSTQRNSSKQNLKFN